jgi:hypothetical protein
VAKLLGLAEFSLRQFRSLPLIGSVNFQMVLADFRLPAILAKHILHEQNDKSRHKTSLCVGGAQEVKLFRRVARALTGIKAADLAVVGGRPCGVRSVDANRYPGANPKARPKRST